MCTRSGGRKGREDDVAQRWVTGRLPALVRNPCRSGGWGTASRAAALTVATVRKGFMGALNMQGGDHGSRQKNTREAHMQTCGIPCELSETTR